MRDPNQLLLWAARNEITEYHIYRTVAARVRDAHNREILEKIAAQELEHYGRWKKILGREVAPARWKVWLYATLSGIFGLSFGLKLMEKGEQLSQRLYQELSASYPETLDVLRDEQRHEEELLRLIDEQHLRYVSSFVLGLNDALVELTGALAGLTLALQETRLIAVVGLITGIAASLSMAASEYLSTREEEGSKDALTAAVVTGIAYLCTVALLITPFLLAANPFLALAITLCLGVAIVFVFTLYTSTARGVRFLPRFLQMTGISLGVAAVNFGVGYVVKKLFGIE